MYTFLTASVSFLTEAIYTIIRTYNLQAHKDKYWWDTRTLPGVLNHLHKDTNCTILCEKRKKSYHNYPFQSLKLTCHCKLLGNETTLWLQSTSRRLAKNYCSKEVCCQTKKRSCFSFDVQHKNYLSINTHDSVIYFFLWLKDRYPNIKS